MTSRYDTGSNERIRSVQPLKNLAWGYRKDIVCVFNIPEQKKKEDDTAAHKLTQTGQRHLRDFMGTGALPKADGIYDKEWKTLYAKAIQTALNKDHKTKLVVDGDIGAKTQAALDKYPCKYGTYSNLNSVLEIGFYLNNINPAGYENPGLYGDGVTKSVKKLMGTDGKTAAASVFLKLI